MDFFSFFAWISIFMLSSIFRNEMDVLQAFIYNIFSLFAPSKNDKNSKVIFLQLHFLYFLHE